MALSPDEPEPAGDTKIPVISTESNPTSYGTTAKNSDNTYVTFGNLYSDDSVYVGLIDVGGSISIGLSKNLKGGSTDILTLSIANADGTETVELSEDESGSYTVTGDEIAIYIKPATA